MMTEEDIRTYVYREIDDPVVIDKKHRDTARYIVFLCLIAISSIATFILLVEYFDVSTYKIFF